MGQNHFSMSKKVESNSYPYYLHISEKPIDGFDIFHTQTDPIYYQKSESKIEDFDGYVYIFNDFLYLIFRSNLQFSNVIADLAERNDIEKIIELPNIELRPRIRNIGSLVCFYHLYPNNRNEMEFHNVYHSSTKIPSEGTSIPNDIRSRSVPVLISSPTK